MFRKKVIKRRSEDLKKQQLILTATKEQAAKLSALDKLNLYIFFYDVCGKLTPVNARSLAQLLNEYTKRNHYQARKIANLLSKKNPSRFDKNEARAVINALVNEFSEKPGKSTKEFTTIHKRDETKPISHRLKTAAKIERKITSPFRLARMKLKGILKKKKKE